jgi:hypothetical protein
MEFDPATDPQSKEFGLAMQFSHYADALEVFWNSYVIVYDSGTQLTLFRSAQDRVQVMQATLRNKSDQWVRQSQHFSDRFSAHVGELVNTAAFWVGIMLLTLAGTAYKHRRMLQMRLQIWRVRQGRGAVSEDIVEQLFYRAAHLVERQASKRQPSETWREWIFGLPDPNRRSILTRALEIFERSKYGRKPVSPSDFEILEETIRELKLGSGRGVRV